MLTHTGQDAVCGPWTHLSTHHCSAIHPSMVLKLADNTPIVGLMSSQDESHYRKEVQNSGQRTNLILNTNRTKRLTLGDLGGLALLPSASRGRFHIDNSESLSIRLTSDLCWTVHTSQLSPPAAGELFQNHDGELPVCQRHLVV